MGNFESQFEDMDIQISGMDSVISSATANSTPQNEIEGLMRQIADENGLEFKQEIGVNLPEIKVDPNQIQDDLNSRLSKLRNN